MLTSFGNLEETTAQQTSSINSVANYSQEVSEYTHHLGEILDVISGMSGTEDEINEKVGKLKEIIHGEVVEIEDNMTKTNQLLERKFDEFTDLLKKSNTEALVEVMKKVTEEFQKQMNSLINKLIQENFDQLNKSVEKLNQWQQENKEMIASLTQQYKEMSDNFEATSSSLTRVKNDTTSLVSKVANCINLSMYLIKLLLRMRDLLRLPRNYMRQPVFPIQYGFVQRIHQGTK